MRRKIKYLFIALLLYPLSIFEVNGQSVNVFRNYYLNQQLINPATAGSEFYPVVNLSISKQWLGFDNSPMMQMCGTSLRIGNFDFYNPKMFLNKTKLKAYEKIGMGLIVYNENNGPVSDRGIKMSYAYHVPFERSRLSFGISGSFDQYIIDQSGFQPVINNDPLIDYSKFSYSGFNTDIGVYYYSPDYYIGFSAVRLLSFDRLRELGLPDKPQYWLHGGYLFRNPGDFMIEPSIFINYYSPGRTLYDLNVKFYHHYVNWISLSYRSYQAIRMRLAVKAKQIYITYSSEFNISRMARYSFGTHEIGIGMNVGIRRIEGF